MEDKHIGALPVVRGEELIGIVSEREYARKVILKGKLSKETRKSRGREGAKAAARKRGASKGTGSGAGAMTVTELRREAAKLGIEGQSKIGKASLIRAVGQKRRSS